MDASLLSTGEPSKPWSVWRLSPVYYAVLIHFLCDGVVIAMMPIFMIRELKLMVSTVGVVATAYNLGRTASSLPSGPIIQRLGPRLSMCLACATSGAFFGLFWFVNTATWTLLLFFGFMAGMATDLQKNAAATFFSREVPKSDNRAFFVAIFATLTFAGNLCGALLGSVVGALALDVVWIWPMLTCLQVTGFAVAYNLWPQESPAASFPEPEQGAWAMTAAQKKTYAIIGSYGFFLLFLRIGYVFMLPIMAVEYDFNTTQTGFLSALSYVFVFIFAPLGGMLQDSIGSRSLALLIMVIGFIYCMVLPAAQTTNSLIVVIIFGSISFCGLNAGMLDILLVAAAEGRPHLVGLYRATFNVGRSIAPVLLAALLQYEGFTFTSYFNAFVCLLSFTIIFFFFFDKDTDRKSVV